MAEPDSHNIEYCGKTVKQLSYRMDSHKADANSGFKRHVYNWLRKVYHDGQKPNVIVCETIDLTGLVRVEQLKLLNEAEQRWISQFKALGFRLTNATNGGDGCHGRKLSEEHRAKLRAANTGRKHTNEFKAKVSASKKAAYAANPESILRGEKHPHYNKKQTWIDPEARLKKISDWYKTGERAREHGMKQAGEKNGNNKLTSAQAISIFQDTRSMANIALEYAIAIPTVWNIKNRRTWKHVTEALE